MKKYVLTVTLNPALDTMIAINHFSLGREFYFEKEAVSAGGKGLNVARTLKALGIPVLATGLIGGKSGQTIQELLKKECIRSAFVQIEGQTRVNLMVQDPTNAKRTRLLGFGPKIRREEIQKFKTKYRQLLKQSCLVVLSGRNANGAPDGLYAELIRLAQRQKIPTVIDTSGRPLALAVNARPWLIKPNLKELEDLVSKRLNTRSKIQQAIQQLHHKGINIILVSLGRHGAMGTDGREIWFVRPPAVDVKSDVGCGDAMLGGFLSAYLKGESFRATIESAVAAGTVNAEHFVPGAISKENVERMEKFVTVTNFSLRSI